ARGCALVGGTVWGMGWDSGLEGASRWGLVTDSSRRGPVRVGCRRTLSFTDYPPKWYLAYSDNRADTACSGRRQTRADPPQVIPMRPTHLRRGRSFGN